MTNRKEAAAARVCRTSEGCPVLRRAGAWPARFGARCVAAAVLLAFALAIAPSAAAGGRGVGGKRSFSTLTQNAYVGADIGRIALLDPTDPQFFLNLLQAVTTTYFEFLAADPQARMEGIADRIAARRPDIVALQEMYLLRRQSPGDLILGGQVPATEVVADFLQILLDALEARGLHYSVVAQASQLDAEMPMLNPLTGGIDDARLSDRDVILARTDLPRGHLRVANPLSGSFVNRIEIPEIGLSIPRGWCSVDVFVRGRKLRFINTHLEEETQPLLQLLQAQELLDGPASTSLPVILVGDFNADANGENGTWTYDELLADGFVDSWGDLHPGDPGLTWGHDAGLADPAWAFVWRIDLVLYKSGRFVPKSVETLDGGLGGPQPPLWPSDHAGVAARFRIR